MKAAFHRAIPDAAAAAEAARLARARRDLLVNLVSREMKARYRGSVLGFLWTLLTPLFMAVIYVFFLRVLAGRGVPMEEILIGVFAWQFTVQSINSGVNCVTGNANLVKKVFFPRSILPVSATLANLVGYLLTLVVQLVLVAALLHMRGGSLSPWAAGLPLVIAFHTVFNLGLAMCLGAANAYFRDTQHIVNVVTSAWFFVSPVMYNLDLLARFAGARPWVTNVYLLNPLAVIITAYRALQLPGTPFPWTAWSVAGMLWPIGFAAAAAWFYRRAQRNFADVL